MPVGFRAGLHCSGIMSLMDQPATVILHRPPAWSDRLRAYRFVVDGEVRGHIRRGKTLSFEIQPGRHWAQALIDWTGSPQLEFEAAPGETVRLEVRPRPNPFTVLWYLPGTTRWLRLAQI